jgi:hypothetical protein
MKKIFVLFALALAFVGTAAIVTTIQTLSAGRHSALSAQSVADDNLALGNAKR